MEKDVIRGLVRRPQCENTINLLSPLISWNQLFGVLKTLLFHEIFSNFRNFHTVLCRQSTSIFSPWFDASHFPTICSDVFWRKKWFCRFFFKINPVKVSSCNFAAFIFQSSSGSSSTGVRPPSNYGTTTSGLRKPSGLRPPSTSTGGSRIARPMTGIPRPGSRLPAPCGIPKPNSNPGSRASSASGPRKNSYY